MFIKLLLAKILVKIDSLFFKEDTFGSKLVLGLDKDLISKLLARAQGEIVLVIGTNGKTTVKHLLKDILEKEDKNIIINEHSKKDCYGILSALIKRLPLFTKKKFDYLIFELKDPASLEYFKERGPEYLIVTNLFKEQISRKHEFIKYIGAWKNRMEQLEKTIFILNGDDPVVTHLSQGFKGQKLYYGLDNSYVEEEILPGSLNCPNCGGSLNYSHRFFGQLGEYACGNCDFDKPAIDYLATNTSLKNGIYFDLLVRGEEYPFDLPAQGFHNVYNILAAISFIEETDIGLESVELALEKIEIDDDSLDTFYIKKPVFLKEAWNISALEQAFEDLSEDDEIIDLLLIYDEEKEYTNIIYDIDIEDLKKDKIRKIYLTGDKAYNMALALKAMGLPLRKLIVDLELNIVLKLALSGKGKKLYIINMDDDTRSIEKQLKRLEKKWSI